MTGQYVLKRHNYPLTCVNVQKMTIFGIFRHFVPGRIVAAKVKKNRRNLRKSWLAAIEQLRTTYRLDILSLNESIQKIKSTNMLEQCRNLTKTPIK